MTRFMIYTLIILAIVDPITATDAKSQHMPSNFASTVMSVPDGVIAENNGIKILGIDPAAFPIIRVNIFIDKSCAVSGNLKKGDFRVMEDENDTAISNFYFTGNGAGQRLDLAIVFDETTSMDSEINALKSKIKDLTQKINSSKLDARYSLVTFNGADVVTKINGTNDVATFRNAINSLSTKGGNSELPENSLDAVERALSFGFRQDTQKIIILATDEPSLQKGDGKSNSAYAMDDVKNDLQSSGAMLIAVSPDFRNALVDPNVPRSDLAKYADMRVLANESSGLWIDIKKSDFSEILGQIQGILTGTYVIEYTSGNKTPSENRTVFVFVDAPGCSEGEVSGIYTTPGSASAINVPPVISSLTSDKVSSQEAGTVVLWTANASDPDGDLIQYKFFLNGLPTTNWQLSNQWPWITFEGEFRIEVRVRDGMHAGPNETDDRRSEIFVINAPALVEDIEEIEVPHVVWDSWQKTFGGLLDDIGAGVLQTSDGGYIMQATHHLMEQAGWISGCSGPMQEVMRSGGKLLEVRAMNLSLPSSMTSDGGYIMVGITSSYGAGGRDLWMIKTDAIGSQAVG